MMKMRLIAFLVALVALPSLVLADCDSSVTAGAAARGLHKINYQRCHWESSDYNPSIQTLWDQGVLMVGSGSSLPGTCTGGLDLFTRTGSTGDPTLFWCQATNTWQQVTGGGGASVTVDGLAGTDDNFEFFTAPRGLTLVAIGCHCDLNCSPAPTLSFATRAGNAISLTAGGDLTCGTGTSDTTLSTFLTSDSDRILTAGQGLNFSVTNSPASARINLVLTYY